MQQSATIGLLTDFSSQRLGGSVIQQEARSMAPGFLLMRRIIRR
jgi:hypothetical protein